MWPILTAPARALSYLTSLVWSWFTRHERAPLPDVFDLLDAGRLSAEIARAYSGDPLGGTLDFSHHPEHIEYHRQQGTLHKLNLDCDDVAGYAYWLLKDRPWIEWVGVYNVYDELDPRRANYSHAVCWFKTTAGTTGIIDTNVIYVDGTYRGVPMTGETPAEYCQRLYGPLGATFAATIEAKLPW